MDRDTGSEFFYFSPTVNRNKNKNIKRNRVVTLIDSSELMKGIDQGGIKSKGADLICLPTQNRF